MRVPHFVSLMNFRIVFLLGILLPGLASTLRAARQDEVLSGDWKFIKQDVAPDADSSAWPTVTIPHTWNAFDGQDGITKDPDATHSTPWKPAPGANLKARVKTPKPDYFRGAGWYARALDLAPEKGRRVFLRFEGAATVAEAWLNGRRLGEHRGGFTAFCFELTPYLKPDGHNELRVRVSNAFRPDVTPISGDFTVDGGIYRPVHLLTTDEVCVSPLDFASPGVFLDPQSLADDRAVIGARVELSNGGTKPAKVTVETSVADAGGKVVAADSKLVTLAPGSSEVRLSLTIPRPHRWQGRVDPYLYTTTTRVRRDGKAVDAVEQPLGLRTIAITEADGFLLNGKPLALHGVNRHQDWRDKGWALADADHDRDFQLMADMGVNAVRLAHYPQATHVYDLADRLGFIVWHEVSDVDVTTDSPEFRENIRRQLRELMLQHYNHPSIAFTGLFNEIRKETPADGRLIQSLNDLAHEVHPGCLTVAAACVFGQKIDRIPDELGFNVYPGWYPDFSNGMSANIDKAYADIGRRVALSEYGAGGNPDQHEEGVVSQPENRSHWHPDEWQMDVLERDWAQIQGNPKLWGSFVWVMFDFASDSRNEGGKPGINDKGLVTQDRAVKKDVYYFYQANWTTKPMLHLVSKGMTPRKNATTEIKAYSNCAAVELRVNGRSLGMAKPDDVRAFRWKNVALRSGENRIEVVAKADGKPLSDQCEWDLAP
jgi:beta-galactosidase